MYWIWARVLAVSVTRKYITIRQLERIRRKMLVLIFNVHIVQKYVSEPILSSRFPTRCLTNLFAYLTIFNYNLILTSIGNCSFKIGNWGLFFQDLYEFSQESLSDSPFLLYTRYFLCQDVNRIC